MTTFVPFHMRQSLRPLHYSHFIGDQLYIVTQIRDYLHQNTRYWDYIVVTKVSLVFAFALLPGGAGDHRMVVDNPKVAGIATSEIAYRSEGPCSTVVDGYYQVVDGTTGVGAVDVLSTSSQTWLDG